MVYRFILFIAICFSANFGLAQAILFEYTGPDTIFISTNGCQAVLDWGHPDTPTASSNLPGGVIDTFYLSAISGGYDIGSVISFGETVEISYFAEDNFGNVDLFNFTIFIGDNNDPYFVQDPMDMDVACDSDVLTKLEDWYNNNAGGISGDSCISHSIEKNISLDSVTSLFLDSMDSLCGNTASVSVDFYAEDEAGNQSDVVTASFNSVDIVKPTIIFSATNLTVNCNQDTPDVLKNWIDNVGNATAVDNCTDSLDWYLFIWSDSEGNDGTGIPGAGPYPVGYLSDCNWFVNVSFFVRDECNNNRATTGTFSTLDNLGPNLLTLPPDITVDCSQIPNGSSVMAYDECLGTFAPEITDITDQMGNFNDCEFYNYTIERTFLATDACGFTDEHVQIITVIDTIGPFFLPPDDITIDCTEEATVTLTGVPVDIFDACNSPFFISFQDSETGDPCLEIITRTWTIADACGNETEEIQLITRADLQPPEMIALPSDTLIYCQDESGIRETLNDWVITRGGALANDNCSLVNSFVALPGSFDLNNPFTFPGVLPDTISYVPCQNSNNGLIRSMDLSFVFYDDCGNTIEHIANFSVADTTAPVFDTCPSDETLFVSINNCELLYTITLPQAYDECSVEDSPFLFQKSEAIVSSIPGDPTAPVDTIVYSIGPIYGIVAEGAIPSLLIEFSNVDMDDSLEFFYIIGEDGTVLDTSNHTLLQCTDTFNLVQSISNTTLLDWLADNYIEISLVPYTEDGIGNFAINDVCGFSFANLTFTLDMEEEYTMSYEVSLNGGEKESIDFLNPNQFVLSAGTHTLDYFVSDCAGNMDSCSSKVFLVDTIPPEVFCFPDAEVVLEAGSCTANFIVEAPDGFTDNCGPQAMYEQKQPLGDLGYLTFHFEQSFNGYLADSFTYSFTGLGANALTDDPLLSLEFLLDGDEPGEYYIIKGEDGTELGTTQPGNPGVILSDCVQTGSAAFMIPADFFNAWAADGSVDIHFIPNLDFGLDFGINPCNPIAVNMDGDNDEQSYLNAILSYGQSYPGFYVTGATTISKTDLESPSFTEDIVLNGGTNEIHYIFNDASGNADTCSHFVEVTDLEYPVAQCQEAIIFVDPSGVNDVIVLPEDIDDGSFDNCGIDSMYVVPDTFNCTMVDSQYTVMLFVTDLSGNLSSCETEVRVEAQILDPQYSASICGADTLKLFANVDLPYPDFQYTYSWTGPNNFVSSEENPVIPNAGSEYSGTFVLIVEGFNGCTSTGTAEVFIQELGTPELLLSETDICIGDNLILETEGYTGNITYHWYEGTYPAGNLMGSTAVPSFIVTPSEGEHFYYLIVEGVNCTSNPSGSKKVEVYPYPGVSVCDAFLTLCEEGTISLCTNETGQDYNYQWTGSNGYNETGQSPPNIENISVANAGDYKLVIDNGVCFSDTAITQVTILEKPAKPVISGAEIYCEGSPIVLTVSNVTDGDLYFWNRDGVAWPPQTGNSLIIPNANPTHAGNWSVYVQKGLCLSDTSESYTVTVEQALNIIANNDGPSCEGDSVQLSTSLIPGASYEWNGPGGFSSDLREPIILAIEGTYNLTVTTLTGCDNFASTYVELVNAPMITAISSNATGCMDGATDVNLFPTVWPVSSSYEFSWEGPGFSSDLEFPTISNFTSANNGIYILQVANSNCSSMPDSIEIIVKDIPSDAVLIEYPEEVCEGDSIILVSNNYTEGTEYTWITPTGNKKTFTNSFVDGSASINDGGDYSVFVNTEGCISNTSEVVQISVIQLPDAVSASGSATLCAGDTIFLFSEFVEDAIYEWIGPGFSSNEQNPVITNASSADQGWYQVRIYLDDCPSEWSSPVIINVIELTEILGVETPDTAVCISEDGSIIELCVNENTSIPGALYQWYNSSTNEIIASSSDLCIMLDDLEDFSEGTLEVYVIGSLSGCTTQSSDTLEISLYEIPAETADAGTDLYNCELEIFELDASLSSGLTGEWSFSNEHEVDDISDPATQVQLNGSGMHQFIWTISNGACQDFSSDTIILYQPEIQDAFNDTFSMDLNGYIDLNIFDNDQTNDTFLINITSPVYWGSLEIEGSQISYMSDPDFTGIVQFEYELCDVLCPELCTAAEVIIQIGDIDACAPYNLITPNNDGINDLFVFACLQLDNQNESELVIYNQWGDEVYAAQPYQNDWDAKYSGEALAAGTYYYVFRQEPESKAVYGFIIIEY